MNQALVKTVNLILIYFEDLVITKILKIKNFIIIYF